MKEIIEKLNLVKDNIISEKGTLRFFGLIARTDLENKWDLLISSDWIEKNSSDEELVYVITKLKEAFSEKLDFLSRIVLLRPEEHFIQELARVIVKEHDGKTGEIRNLKVSDDFTV